MPSGPTPYNFTFLGSVRLRSAVFASMSSPGSWDLRALKTSQTRLKTSLLSSMVSALWSGGIPIGMMTYPYSLEGCLRITRPTACMMSTWEDLGFMKATASSDGTSTPSERHLALESTRHPSPPSRSHCSALARRDAFWVPST